MKSRSPAVTLAALTVVALVALVAMAGCSKDKGTNPTPGTTPESFDSGPLSAPFAHTFTTVGTFGYRCKNHPTMTATVVVDATSTNAAAAVNVGVSGNNFSPASVTIMPGGTVTWTLSTGAHTVTRP